MQFTTIKDPLTLISFKEIAFTEDGKIPEKACFLFHGYGASMDDMTSMALEMADVAKKKNMVFIFPNGIDSCNGSKEFDIYGTHYGRQWFSLEDVDGNIEYTLQELDRSVKAVLCFIEEQEKRLGISKANTLIGGFSQGAILTAHIGAISREPFAGVLSCSGGFLFAPKETVNQDGATPYTIIHGTADIVLPMSWSVLGAKELRRLGHDVSEHYISGMGHTIDEEVMGIIKSVIQKL